MSNFYELILIVWPVFQITAEKQGNYDYMVPEPQRSINAVESHK